MSVREKKIHISRAEKFLYFAFCIWHFLRHQYYARFSYISKSDQEKSQLGAKWHFMIFLPIHPLMSLEIWKSEYQHFSHIDWKNKSWWNRKAMPKIWEAGIIQFGWKWFVTLLSVIDLRKWDFFDYCNEIAAS